MHFKTALIDMDIITYRCGYSIEKYDEELDALTVEPVKHAFYNVNSTVKKILTATRAQNYKGYLTSSDRSNFRFELFPDYKANRTNTRKPIYYKEIRDFLIRKWDAEMISDQEADDAISIEHCRLHPRGFSELNMDSVICSIDKDFNNVPGWHYNFVKDDIYYVTEIDALRNFYLQILAGDAADGVPRIKKGWKQKEIEKQIRSCDDERELVSLVVNEVINLKLDGVDSDVARELVNLRGKLLWLRRKPDEMWSISAILK